MHCSVAAAAGAPRGGEPALQAAFDLSSQQATHWQDHPPAPGLGLRLRAAWRPRPESPGLARAAWPPGPPPRHGELTQSRVRVRGPANLLALNLPDALALKPEAADVTPSRLSRPAGRGKGRQCCSCSSPPGPESGFGIIHCDNQ